MIKFLIKKEILQEEDSWLEKYAFAMLICVLFFAFLFFLAFCCDAFILDSRYEEDLAIIGNFISFLIAISFLAIMLASLYGKIKNKK